MERKLYQHSRARYVPLTVFNRLQPLPRPQAIPVIRLSYYRAPKFLLIFVQSRLKLCLFPLQVNAGIGRSPYMAMFGAEPKLGLSTTTLPPAVSAVLQTEETLNASLSLPSTSSTVICIDCRRQVNMVRKLAYFSICWNSEIMFCEICDCKE